MALVRIGNLMTYPIQEGDAGVILRRDGSYHFFNTHAGLDGANLTARQLEQAETLLAFAVALEHPAIMELLKNMASDPAITGGSIIDKSQMQ